MIKKIVVVTVLLFAGYSLFIAFIAPAWWHASQYQMQDNVVKAQTFIYDKDTTYDDVILGSSLAARLVMDSLPGSYNLSFSGLSIFDGLNILVHKENLPKTVYLETNEVMVGELKSFGASINSPILFYPREKLPALRDEEQPIGVIGSKVNIVTRGFISVYSRLFKRKKDVKVAKSNNGLFSKMLKLQLDIYQQQPDPVVLSQRFNSLNDYINKLEDRGVRFVFFEMPVDYHLNNMPKAETIRQAFYDHFPESKYQYIMVPDSVHYETSDGLHLVRNGALEYTGYLKSKIQN